MLIVETLSAQPQASIPQASECWSQSKATYRFWDNKRVSAQGILEAHHVSVQARMQQSGVVLAIQDTTDLNFTHHRSKDFEGGFGLTSSQCYVRGLKVHTTFGVSGEGVPLGVLDQQVWSRSATASKSGKKNQQKTKAKPLKEKESLRWLKAQVASELDLPEGVALVTVADREADIYELMALPRDKGVHVLLRVCRNRSVDHPSQLLKAAMAQAPIAGTSSVTVSKRKGQGQRDATLTIRYQKLTLKVPANRPQSAQLCDLPMTVVSVQEEHPPEGCKAISWLLISDIEVDSFEHACTLVRWYSLRWLIERYHYVLKSGCQIESLQLETATRIVNALATYAIVAWRLLWLTYEARIHPGQSCEVAFETVEWQALWCTIHRKPKPPKRPPTLEKAVRWVAQLGGFLARKQDGVPGVKTLWRGLTRLHDIADTWRLAHD